MNRFCQGISIQDSDFFTFYLDELFIFKFLEEADRVLEEMAKNGLQLTRRLRQKRKLPNLRKSTLKSCYP